MPHQVKIPAAGESINSATVGQWHKANGEVVQKGDLLATIETDKVSTELEAEAAGILTVLVTEGEEVAIGTVIAEIEENGGAATPAEASGPEQFAPAPAPAADSPPSAEAKAPPSSSGSAEPPESAGEVLEIRVPAAGESITSATIAQWHKRDGEHVAEGDILVTLETDKVSAELEAEANGVLRILSPDGSEVSIGTLIGTLVAGAAPRVDSVSSQEASPAPAPATTSAPAPAPAPPPVVASPPATPAASEPARLVPDLSLRPRPAPQKQSEPVSDGRTTRKRMSMLRRKIATQLVHAQQTAAILTTFNEADMSAVMKLRKTIQEDFIAKHGVKLGFMSFFVKAVVQALKEVPSVNGRIEGDEIVQNHFYDIGIAVGTEKGLIVPVIRDADQKSFARIEQDILDYATKARDGKIQLEDLQGGGFTISNGGIYGSLLSTPILNPPQSGILGMHTIQQRPVAIDGQVEIRPMMYLALSYDHRIVDGKEAVTFLLQVKDCIETPTRLMLEL